MIYISSACFKAKTIKESVAAIAKKRFKNIELSGGTKYYTDYENDLLRLQGKYDLNYQVHNYFPPPEEHFVLNLASLDNVIREQSIQLCRNAIKLSKKLGGKRYGVHAGFLIDFKPKEAGAKINHRKLADRNEALARFTDAWKEIGDEADGDVTLYVENNVFSSTNAETFSGNNLFLLSDYQGYLELKEQVNFNLLLDLAHLKVSANSLKLDFVSEARKLLPLTNYVHLSDNDGFHDQNKELKYDSNILHCLKDFDIHDGSITIEVYGDLNQVKSSSEIVQNHLSNIR